MMSLSKINRELTEKYGTDVNSSLPKYRVVWTTDQLEKRFGTFVKWYRDIRLGEETLVKEVPKYPFYPNFHAFEELTYHANPELVENPSYEPVYIFKDKDENSLPVVWWAVKYVADRRSLRDIEKITQETEDEFMKRQEEIYFQILDDDRPYLPTMMSNGEAAFIDSTKVFKNE